MKSEQLADLLRYRLEQAHETLREAGILLERAALRGAVNRAYYAMEDTARQGGQIAPERVAATRGRKTRYLAPVQGQSYDAAPCTN